MVKSMKQRGIPLDGVGLASEAFLTPAGLQMHVSVDYYPSFADVSSNIARLGALGLEVCFITRHPMQLP
jgi:GH35 family endo-1,4-beta-xylanase